MEREQHLKIWEAVDKVFKKGSEIAGMLWKKLAVILRWSTISYLVFFGYLVSPIFKYRRYLKDQTEKFTLTETIQQSYYLLLSSHFAGLVAMLWLDPDVTKVEEVMPLRTFNVIITIFGLYVLTNAIRGLKYKLDHIDEKIDEEWRG